MNPKAFPAIFPSANNGAMLVMTSSMSPGNNSTVMRILDAKYDDGTPVVKKLNWVQSCAACERKGIPEKCTHVTREPQHFQSLAGQERTRKMLDPEDVRREVDNVNDEPPESSAFESVWIDRMIEHKYTLNEDIRNLFIAIDPSAGKARNLYVLVSAVFTQDGTCVVIGAENINICDRLFVADVIQQHIAKCKQLRFLTHAMPIIIPESNLPGIAMELQKTLKLELKVRCQFMTEDKSNSSEALRDMPGLYTQRHNKPEMTRIFRSYLKAQKVVMSRNFLVAASDGPEITCSAGNIKQEFIRQLRNFSAKKNYKTTKDGTKYCEITYEGIGNDDFVMALMILFLMYQRFLTSDKYKNIRNL